MRYLFGFLCVCALGVVPLVGCFNDILEGNCPGGCDDGNTCTRDDCVFVVGCVHDPVNEGRNCNVNGLAGVCTGGVCDLCAGVVCDDDGNECTWDCNPETGTCDYIPVADGTDCHFDGLPGLCISGVCGEDPCEGLVCDDGNECTDDTCDYVDGCVYAPSQYLRECSGGFCRDGVCEILVDQCTADDLTAIEAGDEPDSEAIMDCTADPAPAGSNFFECRDSTTGCLEDAGSTLTTECSACFASKVCCFIYKCGCGLPNPDLCPTYCHEICQPLLDACVGGQ